MGVGAVNRLTDLVRRLIMGKGLPIEIDIGSFSQIVLMYFRLSRETKVGFGSTSRRARDSAGHSFP